MAAAPGLHAHDQPVQGEGTSSRAAETRLRIRELGIRIGVLPPGPLNAITDVEGVKVGHVTLVQGTDGRTGVTAVVPHAGNLFQDKVPAAVFVANGYGKCTGTIQVKELGTLETPIVLTNTLSVPTAADALIDFTLGQSGNERVISVNPVVGETNDARLNDIRSRRITKADVLEAIGRASGGHVEEGAVGAGTGTTCFGFKGGIGTASRRLPAEQGGYTVGVIVQTNFSGVLTVAGIPLGQRLAEVGQAPAPAREDRTKDAGSCVFVVATDAPLDCRNLERLAQRALLGIARTGGYYANGSGDYAIAFATVPDLRVPDRCTAPTMTVTLLRDDRISPLFQAAVEAAEEAILNSLCKACRMEGRDGHVAEALPLDRLRDLVGGKSGGVPIR